MVNKNNTSSAPQKTETQDTSETSDNSNWNVGRVFWGLLLVLIGGLMLVDNFDLFEVNWSGFWRLWPLIIVATGLSILSLKGLVWRLITIILTALTLGAVVWVMVGDFPDKNLLHTSETTIQTISNNVKQTEVSVKAGAISLKIDTADQDSIVKSKFESNMASVSKTSSISGETQQINLTMDASQANNWWTGNVKSSWDIDLTRNLPLRLNVETGASSTEIDMFKAQLRAINIKTGASSLTLKLGDIENLTDVNIESGVSSIVIRVPSVSGVQLKLEGGLATKSIADLSKVSENTYESSGYSNSKNKINIVSKIGVSSFTIERY
jgi:hypothetical protein